MTDADTIGFGCPHCRTSLTVPASASGAQGPCPHCGSIIQAPKFLMVNVPMVVEASLTYPAVPPPERTLAAPPLEIPELPLPKEEPVAETPVESVVPALPEPAAASPEAVPASATVKSEGREILLRASIIICLGALATIIAVGISLGNKPPPAPTEKPAPAPAAEIPAPPPQPVTPPPAPIAPVEKPVVVARLLPSSAAPAGTDVPALVRGSSLVLGEFLEAKNLDVRMLMIETKSSHEELAASTLAMPLPLVKAYENIETAFDPAADTTDLLFRVDFEVEPGQTQRHLVLLRKHGNLESKVVAEPFLDGFGGRLAKFTGGPSFGTREFRSLITVHNFANTPEIPNATAKSTVKLAIRQGGKELAKAYFPKTSALADKLILMGLKNGVEFPATYTLRWNTEEDPAKPYIELIDVTGLSW